MVMGRSFSSSRLGCTLGRRPIAYTAQNAEETMGAYRFGRCCFSCDCNSKPRSSYQHYQCCPGCFQYRLRKLTRFQYYFHSPHGYDSLLCVTQTIQKKAQASGTSGCSSIGFKQAFRIRFVTALFGYNRTGSCVNLTESLAGLATD